MIKKDKRSCNRLAVAARVTSVEGSDGPLGRCQRTKMLATVEQVEALLLSVVLRKNPEETTFIALFMSFSAPQKKQPKIHINQWENFDLPSEMLNISTAERAGDLILASLDRQQKSSPCFQTASF